MIYFAQVRHDNGPIKIGFTTKLLCMKARQLHHCCPYPLEFIGVMDGDAKEEHALHRKFRADRLRGEWFAPSDELLAFIKSETEVPDEDEIRFTPRFSYGDNE